MCNVTSGPHGRKSRHVDPLLVSLLPSSLPLRSTMDFSASRGKKKKDSEIYSTVVIHGGGGADDASEPESEPDASLPPLLQRLPKDFGRSSFDESEPDSGSDSDNHSVSFSGTVLVKRTLGAPPRSVRKPNPPPQQVPFPDLRRFAADADDDSFNTFVVKSTSPRDSASGSISGTVNRRTGGGVGGGFGSPFVSGVVVDEGRFAHNSRRRTSVSSVPDNVTREDPSTRYELLDELGWLALSLSFYLTSHSLSQFGCVFA